MPQSDGKKKRTKKNKKEKMKEARKDFKTIGTNEVILLKMKYIAFLLTIFTSRNSRDSTRRRIMSRHGYGRAGAREYFSILKTCMCIELNKTCMKMIG